MNIYTVITEENRGYTGIAVTENDRSYSYPELFADVEKTAAELSARGIAPYDRCGFIADDSYHYIVYSLAILKLNAAIIPLSTRAVSTELDRMVQAVPMDWLIAENKYNPLRTEWLPLSNDFHCQKLTGTAGEKTVPPLPENQPPAFIRFSSGTTGDNKGVILSHRSVLERTSACRGLKIERGEHMLWVLDMAFHFVVTILLFLRRGANIVICGKPVERSMAQLMQQYPFTLLYATPYHYQIMTMAADYTPEMFKQLKQAVSTAMKLPQETGEAFRRKFGIPLNQAYGIIEIGLPCINQMDADKMDSVGRLQDAYEVRIDNADSNGIGEILIRGPGMFDAYLSPFRLREDVCRDGYFVTGDLGYLDPERYLFIAGRSKNVIIFAGMKIFPYEVEDILQQHQAVADVCVYGIKTAGWGEFPSAKIVLKQGYTESPELIRELRSFCYAKMSEYKVPKNFEFIEKLQKTASGKIIRK